LLFQQIGRTNNGGGEEREQLRHLTATLIEKQAALDAANATRSALLMQLERARSQRVWHEEEEEQDVAVTEKPTLVSVML
jgi:hypothetical protein